MPVPKRLSPRLRAKAKNSKAMCINIGEETTPRTLSKAGLTASVFSTHSNAPLNFSLPFSDVYNFIVEGCLAFRLRSPQHTTPSRVIAVHSTALICALVPPLSTRTVLSREGALNVAYPRLKAKPANAYAKGQVLFSSAGI